MQPYKILFEIEIPDKFKVKTTEIEFKPIQGNVQAEVKHSNPAEFMSKIINIIEHYSSKHKNEVFSFIGAVRPNEKNDEKTPTTRIKIYQKLISKFVKPENMLRLPNRIIFLREQKQFKELDLITKVDKKSISKNKNKFVKVYNGFLLSLLSQMYKPKFNLKTLEKFLYSVIKQKVNILNDIYYHDGYYTFIQVDKNFKNGFIPFMVTLIDQNGILKSTILKKYNLNNSDFVKKLNKKGKLEKL